ncbi:MAG: Gfo/Idh/MocA family oxidoreductase [Pseudomonadota bacterium]
MIKVGIIGTGIHGSRYARHIVNDLPEQLKLTAISRRGEEGKEQAEGWLTSYYADWPDLIRDPEVEAVIAVTPPVLNVEIARCCVLEKKPLLMEKPLAMDYRSGAGIVAMFGEAGLSLTVGQTLRYNTVIRALRRSLGRVGRLVGFSASHRLEPSNHSWQANPAIAGGGVILQTAVHMFDALRFITGCEVKRVRASMFRVHNPGLEDLFTAQLEMENGVVGVVNGAKAGRGRSGRYEFVGIDGELHGDQIHGQLDFICGGRREALGHPPLGGTIVPLLADWHSFLSGRATNPVSGEEGLAALAVCEACVLSATRDHWVAMESL